MTSPLPVAARPLPVTVSSTRRADLGHTRETTAWIRAGTTMAAWWLRSAEGLAEVTCTEQRTGIEAWFDQPAGTEVVTPSGPPARRGGSRRRRSGWSSTRSTCWPR